MYLYLLCSWLNNFLLFSLRTDLVNNSSFHHALPVLGIVALTLLHKKGQHWRGVSPIPLPHHGEFPLKDSCQCSAVDYVKECEEQLILLRIVYDYISELDKTAYIRMVGHELK